MERIYLHHEETKDISYYFCRKLHPLCILYRKETDIKLMEWEYEWHPNEFCLIMKDGTDLEFVSKLGEIIKHKYLADTDYELQVDFNLVFMTEADFNCDINEVGTLAYKFDREGVLLYTSDDSKNAEHFTDWNALKNITDRISSLEKVAAIDFCKDLKPGMVPFNPSFDQLVRRYPNLLLVLVDVEGRSDVLKIQKEINHLLDAYRDEKGDGCGDKLHAIAYALTSEGVGFAPSFVSALRRRFGLELYCDFEEAFMLRDELR